LNALDGDVGPRAVLFGGGSAGTVTIWDVRSRVVVRRLRYRAPVWAVALSPDDRLLAADTGDAVTLWDLDRGRRRGAPTKMTAGTISQLAFSPDGRLLAVGAYDATATVWDVRSRRRVGEPFPAVKGLIPGVTFEPGGRLLISELESAIEWPLDRPTLQRFACQVAGRDLTREEWTDLLPNQPYRRVCPEA
jgi:WD40 repeat protein